MSPARAPKAPEPERLVVTSPEGQGQLWLRRHVFTRHRQTMRFITPNEHTADHRLHDGLLDHTHQATPAAPVEVPEQEEEED
jgi:hypothetical protein